MIAVNECEHCIDENGEGKKAKLIATLRNEDKIYRCLECHRMWGVDKFGERLVKDDG